MKFLLSLALLSISVTSLTAQKISKDLKTHTIMKDSLNPEISYYLMQAAFMTAVKPEEAVENYRNALLKSPGQDKLREAGIRMEMGNLLIKLKNKEATAQLTKAATLFRDRKDVQGLTEATNSLAELYFRNGLISESLKRYTDLYKVQTVAGEAVLAGNTASRITDIYIKMKDYAAAFTFADIAKNEYDKVCKRDSLGSIYFKIAQIKLRQSKPKLAEFYIIYKALPFYTSADYFQGRLKSFNFLASMYMNQKRYSEAKWFYLQANSQSRSIKDTAATVISLQSLGIVKALKGDYILAKQDMSEAEFLAKEGSLAYLTERFKSRYSSLIRKVDLKTVVVDDGVSVKTSLKGKSGSSFVLAD